MPPGWYQDPSNPAQLRWWDGWRWTEHVRPPVPAAPVARRRQPVKPAVLWGAVAGLVVLILLVGLVLVAVGSRSTSVTAGRPSAKASTDPGGNGERVPTTPPPIIAAPDPGPGGVERLAEVAGIPVLDEEGTVTHTHTLVKLHVGGTALPVLAYIGIDQSNGRIAAVHTHDSSGVVHVESPVRDDEYTIGQFLTLAGWGPSQEDLCRSYVPGPCTVRVVVEAPSAEDRATFVRYGPMPAEPVIASDGLDTPLAQGAVLDVRIDPMT